ncbi:max-binding protein MNT [Trichomycterus rosablanca]|uniref:max-binding protein MNT n=1 Tax=Trichomycterus rosablanca TaxID=2290929 RepID=UPI002F350512
MSIETLLEAAKFLELQAQQQQKTREENELRKHLRLEQKTGKRKLGVALSIYTAHSNHVTSGSESSPDHYHSPLSYIPPPPLTPPSIPITVIPIPVVSSNSAAPLTATCPTLPSKDAHSPRSQYTLHQSNGLKPAQSVQPYPSSIIRASQHALLPQSVSASTQASTVPSLIDDHCGLDSKKRPGGAGTREVHNKLEKNRRAHLKECFETLRKNIPNVDEKKTSNLSVLRSALRYIQTLKRKEKDYEHEMERLAREKISTQQRLAELKNDLSQRLDMIEIERLVRQTVQPEEDQASTSTASEGEDNLDEDVEEEGALTLPCFLSRVPHSLQPEHSNSSMAPSVLHHISVSSQSHNNPAPPVNTAPALAPSQSSSSSLPLTPAAVSHQPQAVVAPKSLAYGHIVATPSIPQTVITHAASHASVIQAVNHVTQTGPNHIAHLVPSSSSTTSHSTVQLAAGPQTIGHITVHPVAHLPALYPQPVTIGHTLSQSQSNGTSALPKQTPVGHQVLTHHPQLVGQTVLNPVTMVTMPSFPISTLKLA